MSALTTRNPTSPTRTRPETPGARSRSPQINAAASPTRSLASRIRPIIATSNAPRLRAFVARSIRPTLPLRGSYAVFLMAR